MYQVIRLKNDGTEEVIARCEYGDDAELLFNEYKSHNMSIRIASSSIFGESEVRSFVRTES